MLVFVSYRSDDVPAVAEAIADRLIGVFGPDRVFIDALRLGPGAQFEPALELALEAATGMVVVIGPAWCRPGGWTSDDFVLKEVSQALRRNVPIVPVLVGDVKMPTRQDLPLSLHDLLRHSPEHLANRAFDFVLSRLERMFSRQLIPRAEFEDGVIEALRASGESAVYVGDIAAQVGPWLDVARRDANVTSRRRILGLVLLERTKINWAGVRTAAVFTDFGVSYCGRTPWEVRVSGEVRYSEFSAATFADVSYYHQFERPVRGVSGNTILLLDMNGTRLKINPACQDGWNYEPLTLSWLRNARRGCPIQKVVAILQEVRQLIATRGLPADIHLPHSAAQ